MASRKAVSGKLKLVLSYTDENEKAKERQISFSGMKPGVEAQNLVNAANALAGLQPDTLARVLETVENEVVA